MQRLRAYVGFKNGELHTERVHDGRGVFEGFTVYHDWSAAATRYDDVREVELRIGARCVQMKEDRRITPEVRATIDECRTGS